MMARLLKVGSIFILSIAILTSCKAPESPMEHKGIKEVKANENQVYSSSFVTNTPSSNGSSEENSEANKNAIKVKYEISKLLDDVMHSMQSGLTLGVGAMFRIVDDTGNKIIPYENLLFDYEDLEHSLECSDAFDILYMPKITIKRASQTRATNYELIVYGDDQNNKTTLNFVRDDDNRWYMAINPLATPAEIYTTPGSTIRINGKILEANNSTLTHEGDQDKYRIPHLVDGATYIFEYLYDGSPDETKNGKEPYWICDYETTLTPDRCHNKKDNHRYCKLKEVKPEIIEKSLPIVKDFRNAIITAAGTGDSSQLEQYLSADSKIDLASLVRANKSAAGLRSIATDVILRQQQYVERMDSPQIAYYIDENTFVLNLGFVYTMDDMFSSALGRYESSYYGAVTLKQDGETIKVKSVTAGCWTEMPMFGHNDVKEEY